MIHWKKIGHFNYEISNTGQVRNMKTGRLVKVYQKTPTSSPYIILTDRFGEQSRHHMDYLMDEYFSSRR
jgi:hypothetical protein